MLAARLLRSDLEVELRLSRPLTQWTAAQTAFMDFVFDDLFPVVGRVSASDIMADGGSGLGALSIWWKLGDTGAVLKLHADKITASFPRIVEPEPGQPRAAGQLVRSILQATCTSLLSRLDRTTFRARLNTAQHFDVIGAEPGQSQLDRMTSSLNRNGFSAFEGVIFEGGAKFRARKEPDWDVSFLVERSLVAQNGIFTMFDATIPGASYDEMSALISQLYSSCLSSAKISVEQST